MSNLLCAIAKNEGAYLAEWIHYHLKCGFDSIWVYVNGTDDYSIDILESISKHHPVEYVICDYINDESYSEDTSHIREGFLKNNKIQSCAYNEAIKKAKDIYNYVMFLDIDEFFISPDMNIKNLIKKHENSDVISMKWYLEAGEHDEFDYVLKNTISCTPSRQIKSITKLKGNYDNILIHSSHSNRVIGGNKVVLEHNTGYFIFHRHLRSHNEYLSLLYRGDTIKNTGNSLKLNRAGFNFNHDNKIQIDSAIVSRFKKSYLEFIETCGISDFLHHSKKKVIENSIRVKKIRDNHVQLNRDLKKIFHGTSIDIIEENTISQTTVDYIRDLAISLENVNLDSSIELMTLASLNRPNGKGIKKKLEQYYNWKRKLNNQQPKIN